MYATNFILQLFACLVLVNAIFYPATAPQFQITGRHYFENTSVRYDWTCFRISFCFDNTTKIILSLEDSWNIYQVLLDEKPTTRIQPHKNNNIILFQSAVPQSHCIDFIKITENHYGPIASHTDSRFNGVQVLSGKLTKPKKQFKFLFDFLGDSITTAFGVQSGRNPRCFFKMKHIQNCLQSWATHISKKFNSDYRVMAVSGKGVLQNAYGVLGPKMGNLYTRITDNSKQFSYKYQDGRLPDAIFVLIGANDYSHIIAPEPHKFVKAYVEMLITVIKQVKYTFAQASPLIISVCDSGFKKQLCINIKQAIKQARYAYFNIHYVQIPEGTLPKQNMGCIGHPNSQGQQAIAEAIYPEVKKLLTARHEASND